MKYALLLMIAVTTVTRSEGFRVYVKEGHNRARRSLPDRDSIFQEMYGAKSTNDSNSLVQTVDFFIQNTDTEDAAEFIVYNTIPGDAILTGFCIENEGETYNLADGASNTEEQARQLYTDAGTTGQSSVLLHDARVLKCTDCRDSTEPHKQETVALMNVAPTDALSVSMSFADGSPENTTDGLKLHYETNVTIELSYPARKMKGVLMSPNYPDPYPNNADLSWLIRVWTSDIVLNATVLSFETEAGCDYLFIYDGPSTTDAVLAAVSGVEAQGQSIVSTGQAMLIKFSSDCGGNEGGFAIEFSSQNITYAPPDNGSIVLEPSKEPTDEVITVIASSGFISSPGYPVQCPPSSEIVWIITSAFRTFITLTVIDFNAAAPSSLTVYDSTDTVVLFTVSNSDVFIRDQVVVSSQNEMTLVLQTGEDTVRKHRGLYAMFQSSSHYETLELAEADLSYHVLTSPNYPGEYYNNWVGQWHITAPTDYVIRFDIVELGLEGKYDILRIYNENREIVASLSGTQGESLGYISSESTALVHFYADGSVSNSGFQMKYALYARSLECPSTDLDLTASSGYVANEDYPSFTYTAADCHWRIVVSEGMYVKIYLESFDSGDSNHDIIFYDGAYASDGLLYTQGSDVYLDNTKTLLSSSNQVLVNLTGSGNSENLKYLFRYYTIDQEEAILCAEQYNITVDSGVTIKSPLYPSYYPLDMSCQWLAQTYVGDYIQFYIDEIYLGSGDSIKFYSGDSVDDNLLAQCDSSHSCNLGTSILGSTSSVLVVFESSEAYRGFFKLKMFANTASCESLVSVLSPNSGYAISPNYPETYPYNYNANYCISVSEGSSIYFFFDDFYTHSGDGLTIYDGNSTSSSTIAYLSGYYSSGYSGVTTGNKMTMTFRTDGSYYNYRGFSMRYSVSASLLPSFDHLHACQYVLINNANEAKYLSPPGSPGLYPGNSDFFWYFDSTFRVDRYYFYFYHFDMDSNDNIVIYFGLGTDDPYTHLTGYDYYDDRYYSFYSQQMTVQFHSDNWYSGKGMYLKYWATV